MRKVDTIRAIGFAGAILLLAGCTAIHPNKNVDYPDSEYIPVNQLGHYLKQEKIEQQQVQLQIEKVSCRHSVLTSYGFSQNPKLLKAYENYTKGRKRVVVHSDGFITYPYDAYARPVIQCAPLRVCSIQLEKGESVNNISLGDSARWQVTNVLSGPNLSDGSTIIELKPTVLTNGITTDMVITTNKRVYQLGLVSNAGAATHMVNFYYPQETLTAINTEAVERYNAVKNKQNIEGNTSATVVNTQNINTRYTMTGDAPAWKPVQVFDDGNKTFIKMPALADRLTLPVVWVLTPNGHKEPLNARYTHPYFILDGIFQKIFLLSGVKKHQVQVVINNLNITNQSVQQYKW